MVDNEHAFLIKVTFPLMTYLHQVFYSVQMISITCDYQWCVPPSFTVDVVNIRCNMYPQQLHHVQMIPKTQPYQYSS